MKPFLTHLMTSTIIWGALGAAAPAYAQDQAQVDEPSTGPVESVTADGTTADNLSADGDAAEGEAIVVTGSRIPQPNLTAVSPVTVLSSQEVKLQGTTRAEDLVNSLPQVFGGMNSNISNGATGTATLNLRGLGAVRTLILVNGRRLIPGDPGTPVPDINVIPTAIVERVDVLTGGASSVYGSDAVAGVVNFIMDTDFEGLRLDGQYSFYQHHNNTKQGNIIDGGPLSLVGRNFAYPRGSVADGGTVDLNAVFGASFDDGRGHVTAYAGYRQTDPITQNRRDYSACATQGRTRAQIQANPDRILDCGGSATSDVGTFFTNDDTFQTAPTGRAFVPGVTFYNFAPNSYYQRADERYTAGLFAEYEVSQAVKPYLEFMFMDDLTTAQVAESGSFGDIQTINCDNPLLSPQQLAIACADANLVRPADDPTTPDVDESDAPPIEFTDTVTGGTYNRGALQVLRRNVEGGPRRDNLQHTSFRTVIGSKGDLSPAWSYDAYYLYGQTNFSQRFDNDVSRARLLRAVDVVTDPNTGLPVCRSVLDGTDPNCVPYDIFARGQVTPEATQYFSIPGFTSGFVKQSVASASLTGLLGEYGIQSPWANEGIGINVGLEYRKDSLELNADVAFQTGDLTGQGGPTASVAGSYDVRELYAETRIPIVSDGFFEYLGIEAGYRYSKYEVANTTNTFSTDTYKLGLDFAPIRDIRLRASYNRAVRAPNVQELFAPQVSGNLGSSDPCAGDSTVADNPATPQNEAATGTIGAGGPTFAQCALTGVTEAQFGNIVPSPASQYLGITGGNLNLEPEKSDTYSVGLVLQPRFLPGFSATVDYFDIKVANTIAVLGFDTILATCLANGDPTACSLIDRDFRGSLWLTVDGSDGVIRDANRNIGSLRTKGIDVGASYQTEIGDLGNVGLNFVGTWLDKARVDNGLSVPYDCAGYYGNQCGTPNPEWRHKARLTYTSPEGIGISLQWRYFDAVTKDKLSPNPTLNNPAPNQDTPRNDRIPAQSYFDLSTSYRVSDNYTFRLGVNNILDREPPIIGSQGATSDCPGALCNGNTFPGVYDALGRYIFAGVTLDF